MEHEQHSSHQEHCSERPLENTSASLLPSSEDAQQTADPIFSRLRARFGLDESYLPTDTSIPSLLVALKHPHWHVRTAVARRLGSAGAGNEVKAALVAALLDHVPPVRAAAVRALSALDDDVPEEQLLYLLRHDEDEDVRIAAVQALSVLGERLSDVGVTVLNDLFHSANEDAMTRSSIIYTLGELGKRTPIALLQEALQNDSDWIVREAAVLVMAELGERADSDLLEAVTNKEDEHPEVIQAAYQALGTLFRAQQEQLEQNQVRIQIVSNPSPHPDPPEQIKPAFKLPQQMGNVAFDGIQPGSANLQDRIPVVAQALDNQWLPDSLLHELINGRVAFGSLRDYLTGLVRTEYLRSLINGQQVIINRAFLYNNPVIVQDYKQPGPARDIFKQFLNEGVIVPFLLYEKSPDQRPEFAVEPPAFAIWQQICQETHMQCLRFSWRNEETNQYAIQQLTSALHDFAQSNQTLNIGRLASDLGLPADQEKNWRKTLSDLHIWSMQVYDEQGKWINREDIYRRYITVGDPAQRVYDGSKAFAGTLKRLYDVVYNYNLAQALSGYLLTPAGSPTSLVLQDWHSQRTQHTYITTKEIIDMLRGKVFEIVQSGLYLRSIGLLRLQDVREIRKTEQWHAYIQSLQQLLNAPLQFAHRANEVYQRYIKLAQVITSLVETRDTMPETMLKAEWTPTARLLINVGGSTTEVQWNSAGERPFTNATEQKNVLPKVLLGGSAPVNIRLVIGDSRSASRLQTGIDILQGRMHDAEEQWLALCDQLVRQLHEREFSGESSEKVSTLNTA